MYRLILMMILISLFMACSNENEVKMGKQFYVSVGEQIREHRISIGLSQQELADSVNITQNSLSLIEDGLATPIHTKLILIQDFFDVKFKINGKYAKIEEYLKEKSEAAKK